MSQLQTEFVFRNSKALDSPSNSIWLLDFTSLLYIINFISLKLLCYLNKLYMDHFIDGQVNYTIWSILGRLAGAISLSITANCSGTLVALHCDSNVDCFASHTEIFAGSRYRKVLSVRHATFMWFSTLRTFAGVAPLHSIAADNKIFPAGVSLMRGWLVHSRHCSQWEQCCLRAMNVPFA